MAEEPQNRIFQSGAGALLQAMRAGAIGAMAVTQHYLQRIARLDGRLNAYNQLATEQALQAAAQSAERYRTDTARPLEGLPLAIKANIACAGLPAHAGIAALDEAPAGADAEVVRRLRAAGAVVLGITNMHEGAFGATTDNPHFGRSHNPWRHGFTPGGSSGGSGVAVAASLCAAALGTDTYGSVRIPASWCGITALKPTHGLVSNDGVVPLVERFDCVGPMTATVADCGLLLQVMADPPPSRQLRRIAVPELRHGPDLHPAVAAAWRLAQSILKGLGAEIRTPMLEIDYAGLRRADFLIGAQSARRIHAAMLGRNPQGFSADFHARLGYGKDADAVFRDACTQRIADSAAELHAMLQVVDAILLPTTPQPAFDFAAEIPQSLADFTALASIAGLPALSLPAGWTSDGLPVAVQLIGRPHEDMALVTLAGELEQALNARRWPADAD